MTVIEIPEFFKLFVQVTDIPEGYSELTLLHA
jgi:hypothetical protein